ncbi:MAG: peptide chain release factor N(5)-glutamine methyltransferase [Polyangiales bacterium]
MIEWSAGDFAARNISTPRLDAELLVAEALSIDRVGLYMDLDRPLVDAERAAVRVLVGRRREREPVAYILGYRDFYGRRFEVSNAVLIPRPDTETLVEHALRCIPADRHVDVLDVGTGSGAVALTIAAERPSTRVTGTDLSDDALKVANANRNRLGLDDRVHFERADVVNAGGPYGVVVSNPPYVTNEELRSLEPEVRDHEPTLALEGGADGLDVVRALLRATAAVTAAGADLLVEIGRGQARSTVALGEETRAWSPVDTYPDINGVARVVHLRRT